MVCFLRLRNSLMVMRWVIRYRFSLSCRMCLVIMILNL